MSLLYILLALVFLLLLLFHAGKPTALAWEIDRFLETYQHTDFSTYGRKQFDYLVWKGPREQTRACIRVNFGKGPLKWGFFQKLLLNLHLEAVEAPQDMAFSLFDPQSGRLFTAGETLQLSIDGHHFSEKAFNIRIEHEQLSFAQDRPLPAKIRLHASISARRLFVLSFQQTRTLEYEFMIGPDYGDVWMSIDPGTSGTCIAAGSPQKKMYLNRHFNNNPIIPSVLTFDTRQPLQQDELTFEELIRTPLLKHGFDALATVELSGQVSFMSIKKLLGYKYHAELRFADERRLPINGKQLSALFIKRVYLDFKRSIEKNNQLEGLKTDGRFQPRRAIVAVPNNFTNTQITELLSCFEPIDNLREIRYITESEAILNYYLYKHQDINPNSQGELKDETVLIVDMGGATINVTIADIYKHGEHFEIDIDSKVGYGIGGDSIDYCLAKTLFEYADHEEWKACNPFDKSKGKTFTLQQKRKLQWELLLLKQLIIERFYHKPIIIEPAGSNRPAALTNYDTIVKEYMAGTSDKKQLLLTTRELERFFSAVTGISKTIDEKSKLFQQFRSERDRRFPLFENPLFKRFVFVPLKEAVEDAIKLSEGAGAFIDAVLFSGRSTLFPGIKETVQQVLYGVNRVKEKNKRITPAVMTLKDEYLKTAVAEGALWYARHSHIVKFSAQKTFVNIGFKHTNSISDRTDFDFHSLIPIGAKLSKKEDIMAIEQTIPFNSTFSYDDKHVHFYQIMSSDPVQVLKAEAQHKYSHIESFKLSKRTANIGASLDMNDRISLYITDSTGSTATLRNSISLHEVTEVNEEHYTWIVENGTMHKPTH